MKSFLTAIGSLILVALIMIIAINVGALIATSAIIGFVSALGIILVAFRSPFLMKSLLSLSVFIDAIVFVGGIVAVIFLGVTMASGIVFTGVFFTLMMKPITLLSTTEWFKREYKINEVKLSKNNIFTKWTK